jgi:hypothetical protein
MKFNTEGHSVLSPVDDVLSFSKSVSIYFNTFFITLSIIDFSGAPKLSGVASYAARIYSTVTGSKGRVLSFTKSNSTMCEKCFLNALWSEKFIPSCNFTNLRTTSTAFGLFVADRQGWSSRLKIRRRHSKTSSGHMLFVSEKRSVVFGRSTAIWFSVEWPIVREMLLQMSGVLFLSRYTIFLCGDVVLQVLAILLRYSRSASGRIMSMMECWSCSISLWAS